MGGGSGYTVGHWVQELSADVREGVSVRERERVRVSEAFLGVRFRPSNFNLFMMTL